MTRLIRIKEVLQRVPLSRATIYTRMAAGTFPKSRDLGGGVVAWHEQDIDAWIASCPASGEDTPNKVGVDSGVS